jgi:serine protease Do
MAKTILKVLPLSAAFLLILAGCGGGGESSDPRRTAVVAAVAKALPSVVNIGTERMVRTVYEDPLQQMRERLREQLFSDFFGRPPPSDYQLAHSLGSGVVIHPDGFILTNHHVIDKASTIYVTVGDLQNAEAELLAGDPVSDLALLKVACEQPLVPVDFARDDDLLLGEQVIVLGNPYGLSQSVTVGVLSSKEREARYNGDVLFKDILQTDAAVNPGSSGGPLLNIRGELIGVNIAVYKDAQNIGFAVPVKRVRQLLEHWLAPEFLCGRTLGLAVEEDAEGLRIGRVYGDGPAAGQKLEAGDRILTVDGRPVSKMFDFRRAMLASALHKQPVEIGLGDGLGRHSLRLDWMELPKPSGIELARERLGLEFELETPREDGSGYRGLALKEVFPDSPAAERGLYPGLKLLAINGQPVQSIEAVGEALKNVRSGDKLHLTIAELREQGPVRMLRQIGVEMLAR